MLAWAQKAVYRLQKEKQDSMGHFFVADRTLFWKMQSSKYVVHFCHYKGF